MPLKIFGFSIFNIKNGCISTLVSSYRVAASFITSKFLEHNTENEKFEKSRVLQKYPLMHITLIIMIIIIVMIIMMMMMMVIIKMIIISNSSNNKFSETTKYWVNVQREIVLSHGERDPL